MKTSRKKSKGIVSWPTKERPRERLLAEGPESLSDAELLAIFLRVGVKGKNAIVLAKELLTRFGSLRGLYAAPVDELRAVLGIGDAKIAQFKAVIEMSKRYLAERFHDRPYVESTDRGHRPLQAEGSQETIQPQGGIPRPSKPSGWDDHRHHAG